MHVQKQMQAFSIGNNELIIWRNQSVTHLPARLVVAEGVAAAVVVSIAADDEKQCIIVIVILNIDYFKLSTLHRRRARYQIS